MRILLTGSTGQLGREIVTRLLQRGAHLALLARDVPKAQALFPDCDIIAGDIVQEDLGIKEPMKLDAVYHLAADINLGNKQDDRVWATNYNGTANVIRFCEKNSIPRLFYAGTAYTEKGRNAYEKSKKAAEQAVESSTIAVKTIFKIGILIPSLKEPSKALTEPPYLLAHAVCLLHGREDLVRRRLEGQPDLPVREPVFRIRGIPEAKLNLVPVDVVSDFIVNTTGPGKFWLTHPNPPRLSDLARWGREVFHVRIEFAPDFGMTDLEALFHEGAKPFLPYLMGDEFPSDLKHCPDISTDFATLSVTHSIMNLNGKHSSKWLR
jgi:nucleoside-diphosphate-sugar epimerase